MEKIELLGKQQRQELRNRLGILKVENDQKKVPFQIQSLSSAIALRASFVA